MSSEFNLTKLLSNHSDFNLGDHREKLLQNESDSTKALGVHWNTKSNSFKCHLHDNFNILKVTKRNILSVSSK